MTDSRHLSEGDAARQLLTSVAVNMPLSCVESLLERISHPDLAVDPDGNTALMVAAKNANLALVDVLMSRGASVNRTDLLRHRTALMCAVKTGNRETVERLLSAGDIARNNK